MKGKQGRAGSFFVAEFTGTAASIFPLLAGRSSRTVLVCSHSSLVSTQSIVYACKDAFVLLVPKPYLFRSQTDNVRKASVLLALFDRACLEERFPERSSQPLHVPTQPCVDEDQPLAVGRARGAHRLCSLPGASSAPFLALGRREQGAAPMACRAGAEAVCTGH